MIRSRRRGGRGHLSSRVWPFPGHVVSLVPAYTYAFSRVYPMQTSKVYQNGKVFFRRVFQLGLLRMHSPPLRMKPPGIGLPVPGGPDSRLLLCYRSARLALARAYSVSAS